MRGQVTALKVKRMPEKSVILLSGGLDSAVNLAWAKQNTEPLLALTFDYRQRSSVHELESGRKLSEFYGIPWESLRLDWLWEISTSALVKRELDLPSLSFSDLDDTQKKARDSAKMVWIPNRNGLFVNIAASYAESIGASLIVAGFNREEGTTFPDNSPEFVESANEFFKFSTLSGVRVFSCSIEMNKKEILEEAIRLQIPFQYIWSCYEGDEQMCGRCESCLRLKRALKEVGDARLEEALVFEN